VTAGASAPESLVEEVVAAARRRFVVTLEERVVARENVTFKLPTALNRARREAEEAAFT
jgi:4-hydroxy-3-methylbut-2-enyl diphosphate reductase